MTYMFEVYYKAPADLEKEAALLKRVSKMGGRLDFREEPENNSGPQAVVLTYEFDDRDRADEAAEALRQQGEHVEGPQDYGT
jgi:hypothetical protein